MFRRNQATKPLKVTNPLKFVKEGENLDIANAILNVEFGTAKTPKRNRVRASTMSSQRRSQSIERIFKKEKKEELQKELDEIRYKEKLLIIQNTPLPTPPPPPPAKLTPIKREEKPSNSMFKEHLNRPMIEIKQSEILAIRKNLKKSSQNTEAKPVEDTRENNDELFKTIRSQLSEIRSHHAMSSDDDQLVSDDSEEF